MTTALADLDPRLSGPLGQLLAACPGVSIISGKRSSADQTRLWLSSDRSGRMVAKPGSSNHEYGLAADLAGNLGCAHAQAARFGLVFPMSYEPWHIEPIGAKALRGNADPAAGAGSDPTSSAGPSSSSASSAFATLGKPSTAIRAVEVLVGAGLVMMGLVALQQAMRHARPGGAAPA